MPEIVLGKMRQLVAQHKGKARIADMFIGLAITDLLNMVRDGRRTAKKYLAKRGLPRPKIPWKRVQAFYKDNS